MARPGEHLLRGSGLHDPTEVHHGDPVGDVPGQPEVVGDDQHAEPELLAELEQQRQDLAADRGVERGHRLVGDQQLGSHRERAGDQHALPLPAGQLVGVAQEERLRRAQPGGRQGGGDQLGLGAALRVGVDQPVDPQSLGDRLVDGVARVEGTGGVLQHQLDPAPYSPEPADGVVEGLAVEPDLSGGRPLEAEQGASERGLPRARLADQRQDLSGRQLDVGPVEGAGHLAATGGELHRQAVAGQQRVPHDSPTLMQAAARPAPCGSRRGSVSRQAATARGHRGSKEHPGGSSRRSGGSPPRPAGA